MVVVRLTGIGMRPCLWVHEYGHNVGLSHSSDCARDHVRQRQRHEQRPRRAGVHEVPCALSSANAVISVAGACTDDGDALADPIDNCPSMSNPAQIDTDGDGIGDCLRRRSDPVADIDGSGRVDGRDLAISRTSVRRRRRSAAATTPGPTSTSTSRSTAPTSRCSPATSAKRGVSPKRRTPRRTSGGRARTGAPCSRPTPKRRRRRGSPGILRHRRPCGSASCD